jgi:dephospho-CoA kinase
MTKPDKLDLVVVAGSPGSGKTTLCHELRARWGIVPMIDLGDLRNFHLDRLWESQSERELAIAFDHLVYIVHSYARHNWTPVLVNDLREEWVARTHEFFGDLRYVIVTLFTSNEAVAQRVGRRDDGFTNVAAAVAWNDSVMSRPLLANEVRVDTSGLVAATADHAERILTSLNGRPVR